MLSESQIARFVTLAANHEKAQVNPLSTAIHALVDYVRELEVVGKPIPAPSPAPRANMLTKEEIQRIWIDARNRASQYVLINNTARLVGHIRNMEALMKPVPIATLRTEPRRVGPCRTCVFAIWPPSGKTGTCNRVPPKPKYPEDKQAYSEIRWASVGCGEHVPRDEPMLPRESPECEQFAKTCSEAIKEAVDEAEAKVADILRRFGVRQSTDGGSDPTTRG